MELDKGEVLAILGESGIGKSTMLRIIAGLEEAHKGSMTIGDKIIFSEKLFVEPKNRGIGMVFQDYALFPHMTVKKNIQYGLKKMSKAEKENIAMEMLKLVNLVEHKDKYPYELSGGQQQRVAIARALVNKPKILFADEPTGALDSKTSKDIMKLIQTVWKEQGITVIMVTHDDGLANQANRIIRVVDGKILE